MTSLRYGLAAAFAAMALLSVPAAAAEQNLGSFSNWTAWKKTDDYGLTYCYIESQPSDWEPREVGGRPVNRSRISFFVIRGDRVVTDDAGTPLKNGDGTLQYIKSANEVHSLVGYPLDPNSRPSATVDGKRYDMVPLQEGLWLADDTRNGEFAAAMKAGTKLVVTGTSQRGNNMIDTYDLKGVTLAMAEIEKSCN